LKLLSARNARPRSQSLKVRLRHIHRESCGETQSDKDKLSIQYSTLQNLPSLREIISTLLFPRSWESFLSYQLTDSTRFLSKITHDIRCLVSWSINTYYILIANTVKQY